MSDSEIFNNQKLRTGGFYELAIQVCSSTESTPIKLYTDLIWGLNQVAGPFNNNFEKIQPIIENIRHEGLLRLGSYSIPFITYNIRESSPVETGYNWFDLCIYTSAIEHIFGPEYSTWGPSQKVPNELMAFFTKTIKKLYELHTYQLAILDFEVSGQYYLEDLFKPLNHSYQSSKFFIGKDNYDKVAIENRQYVTVVESM